MDILLCAVNLNHLLDYFILILRYLYEHFSRSFSICFNAKKPPLTIVRFRFDLLPRAAEPPKLRILPRLTLRSRTALGVDRLPDHVGHRVVAHQIVVDRLPVGDVVHH